MEDVVSEGLSQLREAHEPFTHAHPDEDVDALRALLAERMAGAFLPLSTGRSGDDGSGQNDRAMSWRVEVASEVQGDLLDLHDFVLKSVFERTMGIKAARRAACAPVRAVDSTVERLMRAPWIGTGRDESMDGLRSVTARPLVIYFVIERTDRVVPVLGVVHPSSDHQARMRRCLGEG